MHRQVQMPEQHNKPPHTPSTVRRMGSSVSFSGSSGSQNHLDPRGLLHVVCSRRSTLWSAFVVVELPTPSGMALDLSPAIRAFQSTECSDGARTVQPPPGPIQRPVVKMQNFPMIMSCCSSSNPWTRLRTRCKVLQDSTAACATCCLEAPNGATARVNDCHVSWCEAGACGSGRGMAFLKTHRNINSP